MTKISAFNILNNCLEKSPFNSFNLQRKAVSINSPYHYDEERAKKEQLKESELLTNDLKTNKEIIKHKVTNSLIVYPVKGFKGDRNSNFYEYLTMGMFPYITGGLTLIALFNGITKKLRPDEAKSAKNSDLLRQWGLFYMLLQKLFQISLYPLLLS